MGKVTLTGKMARGRFEPDLNQAGIWKAMGTRFQGPVLVTIEPVRQEKTDLQRGYYFGAVLPALTEYYNRSREGIFPVHSSVVHLEIKRSILGVDEQGNVLRSRDLNTAEYAKFTDDIRAFLATKGINVPSPEERWEQAE